MSIAQNSSKSSRSLNLSHSGGMIDAIADWCDALRGGLRLQDAFAGLAAGLRADAGMLVRTALSDFRPSRIAIWDRSGTDFRYPLSRSFADSYFGSAIARPRTASLWRKSDFVPNSSEFTDPALEIWQEHRGFSEYVVLVLASGSTTRDHIELHFRYGLSSSDMENLEAIVPTMGRIWATRQVGLVTRCVVNHRRPPELKMQEGARLLSMPESRAPQPCRVSGLPIAEPGAIGAQHRGRAERERSNDPDTYAECLYPDPYSGHARTGLSPRQGARSGRSVGYSLCVK